MSDFDRILHSSNEKLQIKRRKLQYSSDFSIRPDLKIELNTKMGEISKLSRKLKERNDLLDSLHPVDVYNLDLADRIFYAQSQRNHLMQMKHNLIADIGKTISCICKEKLEKAVQYSEDVYENDIEQRVNRMVKILVSGCKKKANENENQSSIVRCSSTNCGKNVEITTDFEDYEMKQCTFCHCPMCTSCVLDSVARGRINRSKLIFQSKEDEFERYKLYMKCAICPECFIVPNEKLGMPNIKKL